MDPALRLSSCSRLPGVSPGIPQRSGLGSWSEGLPRSLVRRGAVPGRIAPEGFTSSEVSSSVHADIEVAVNEALVPAPVGQCYREDLHECLDRVDLPVVDLKRLPDG